MPSVGKLITLVAGSLVAAGTVAAKPLPNQDGHSNDESIARISLDCMQPTCSSKEVDVLERVSTLLRQDNWSVQVTEKGISAVSSSVSTMEYFGPLNDDEFKKCLEGGCSNEELDQWRDVRTAGLGRLHRYSSRSKRSSKAQEKQRFAQSKLKLLNKTRPHSPFRIPSRATAEQEAAGTAAFQDTCHTTPPQLDLLSPIRHSHQNPKHLVDNRTEKHETTQTSSSQPIQKSIDQLRRSLLGTRDWARLTLARPFKIHFLNRKQDSVDISRRQSEFNLISTKPPAQLKDKKSHIVAKRTHHLSNFSSDGISIHIDKPQCRTTDNSPLSPDTTSFLSSEPMFFDVEDYNSMLQHKEAASGHSNLTVETRLRQSPESESGSVSRSNQAFPVLDRHGSFAFENGQLRYVPPNSDHPELWSSGAGEAENLKVIPTIENNLEKALYLSDNNATTQEQVEIGSGPQLDLTPEVWRTSRRSYPQSHGKRFTELNRFKTWKRDTQDYFVNIGESMIFDDTPTGYNLSCTPRHDIASNMMQPPMRTEGNHTDPTHTAPKYFRRAAVSSAYDSPYPTFESWRTPRGSKVRRKVKSNKYCPQYLIEEDDNMGHSSIVPAVVQSPQVTIFGQAIDFPHEITKLTRYQRILAAEQVVMSNRLLSVLTSAVLLPFVFSSPLQLANPSSEDTTPLPLVVWHGLGDSYENEGLRSIIDLAITTNPGTHVHLIKFGDTGSADSEASFQGNLTLQIDEVCKTLASDPILSTAPAINALGFSQGGQFLRGYVERCNKPRVHNLVTFGSQHNGISSFNLCRGTGTWLCQAAEALLLFGVWSQLVQSRLVPAQYFRDPEQMEDYLQHSNFLADINNERAVKNGTYKKNLVSLNKFVMLMFDSDETVVPKESAFFTEVNATTGEQTQLRDRPIYTEDWIGLRALDVQRRLIFRTIPGDHMQLSDSILQETFRSYFAPVHAKQTDNPIFRVQENS
ncbi:hypothetical protein FQN57_003446 [Myotisia sp. PD_48]|nr:hypothetical protein FQN57_003446 [Myotisia sp. PD_48]